MAALAAARPAAAAKIACVGDSITYGYGLGNRTQECYPAVLQGLLGSKHTVQNFGTNSVTLLKKGDKPYWNDGNFSASDSFKPDIVVIMLGTNDAKPQNWSHKADFAGDYASMISHYRGLGAQVYVATPPPLYPPGAYDISPEVISDEIVPLIRQIAADQNAPLVDVFQALSGKDSYFPDKVHPNAEGAKLLAQTVATALQAGLSGTGGATGRGGATAGGGGLTGSGGATRGTGGASGDGGSSSAGGAAGGSGGSAPGSGGRTAGAGGIPATGGASASGGAATSGGAWGSGGSSGARDGSAGAGGLADSGGKPAQGGRSGGIGGATGGNGAGGGSAGTGGSTGKPTGDDDGGGCSCRLPARGPAHAGLGLALLLLWLCRSRGRPR